VSMAIGRNILSLGLGMYAGVYICQNYNIPLVPTPAKVLDKIQKWLEENKKDKGDK